MSTTSRWLTIETEAGHKVRLRVPTGQRDVDRFLRRICRLADMVAGQADIDILAPARRRLGL